MTKVDQCRQLSSQLSARIDTLGWIGRQAGDSSTPSIVPAMAWDLPLHPANEVRTREDLAAFVATLRDDFIRSGTEWENPTLDRYLDALSAWIIAAPGWYSNFGQELPADGKWTFFAQALAAAVVYE